MPTTKRRYALTETDALADALAVAARRWPGKGPTALLALLVEEGHRAIAASDQLEASVRRHNIIITHGIFDADVYGPGYLQELRKDWPA